MNRALAARHSGVNGNCSHHQTRQRARILDRLRTRISREGILRVVASKERSQRANREAALVRFVELLAASLAREAPRVPTRVSRSAKARRVDAKKKEGAKKRLRSFKGED